MNVERRKPRTAHVGIFGVGYHVYWQQFPGLLEELHAKLDVLVGRVRATGVRVTNFGMVDKAQDAYALLPRVKEADLDLVFCDMLTYATSATFAAIIRDLDAPIVLVALQPRAAMDYPRATTHMQLANDDFCSVPEFTGVAIRMGQRPPEVVLGTLENDPAADAEIADWCDVAMALHDVRRARIGHFGHPIEHMLDMQTDQTALTAAFGCHIVQTEADDLLGLEREVTREAIEVKSREILGLFDTPEPGADPLTRKLTSEHLERAARVAVTLDKFIELHQLDGLAYYYEGEAGSPLRSLVTNLIVGNSLLTAAGFPMCGESDLKTCIAMLLMDRIDIGGSFAEFHPIDFREGFVLVGHDGPHHINIADGKPVLRSLLTYHGKPGAGASVEFRIKAGPITMLSIGVGAQGRFKFVLAEGESVRGPIPATGNTNTRGFFKPDIRTFLKRWVAEGPTHHFALGVGHRAQTLRRIADALGYRECDRESGEALTMLKRIVCVLCVTVTWLWSALPMVTAQAADELERGFRSPPPEARPHAYWLWLNGYLDADSARTELQAMKEVGLSGVLVFDMGAQGDKALQPPPGPAFLSPDWMKQFHQAVGWAKELGLQCDLSVVSSWDLGGHWIEPRHASMGLYPIEMTLTGNQAIDVALPFPPAPTAAPKNPDGKPVFWRDVAVLAARDAQRQPGRQTFAFPQASDLLDVTDKVDRQSRLRWDAPPGTWTILRYVCMNTGERLKVPSPASDGWATDHLSAEATRAHMDYVIAHLRETFGNPAASGLVNLYLASYEVRGLVWSPGFTDEFQRRRGYDMKPYLPAIFGSTVGGEDTTARFLFDYRKTLGEVLVDAYYGAAREVAHAAGLSIKSEAGGPGPPAHNVPVDALLANSAVDAIQGEFWPFRPNDAEMWVVKETAAAGHIYGKRLVHMESFTSMENWREGPQDLKPSADRVFVEGGNHMVWHTWAHVTPAAGMPGWGYHAGTHLNRNRIWWPLARPFIEYLSRCSYLLQRGRFVADALYYYGDGGYKFVHARHNEESLGPGYDYDVINSDGILNRLTVRDGRLMLPDGTDYPVLVLPKVAAATLTLGALGAWAAVETGESDGECGRVAQTAPST